MTKLSQLEQATIAAMSREMDAELVGLEHRREKTCARKQGMMQEFHSGGVWLV